MRAAVKVVVVFLILFFARLATAQSQLVGEWENQLGSTLSITKVDSATGMIEGKYKSPSGTTGADYPLNGWSNSKTPEQGKDNVLVVCFSVRWSDFGSVTTWNGYLRDESGVPVITTSWLLVRSVSSFPWDHTLTGSDIFKRKESTKK